MHNEIIVLSETEAVRKNPSMYIGSVCEIGAHHLLYELIHNATDESVLGTANEIKVIVNKDTCVVSDNGRGLPIDINPKFNLTNAELVLTKLHSGSKFKKGHGVFTTGLHGVGLSCVNALSDQMQVSIYTNSGMYILNFNKGIQSSGLERVTDTNQTGTQIFFSPDKSIFTEFKKFDFEKILNFINELSFFYPKVKFIIENKETNFTSEFQQNNGSLGLLKFKMTNIAQLLSDSVEVNFSGNDFSFSSAINWTNNNENKDFSYVNGVNTYLGGTHLTAFRQGVTNAIKKLIKRNNANYDELAVDEVFDGVYSIVSLKLINPNFEGQTKNRLTNREIIKEIEMCTEEKVYDFFIKFPQFYSIIFDRINSIRSAKAQAKRVAERVYLQYGIKKIDEKIYKEQFGARSKNWHNSAVWITHDELLKEHANHFKLSEDAVALDVCCGSGVVGASFKGKVKKIIGLDLTPEMLALSKTRLDDVVQGNVYNIPFDNNSFDLVCTREVLHLLPYPEKPVSEIFRVLKPGGQFIVGQILPFSEVDGPWMYRIFKKKQPLIYNMFQEEDFRKMLTDAGFVDIEMTEMNVWENIDVWINSYETTDLHRHEIREIYKNASEEVREAHPFKILPNGEIHDLWRWCIFSVRKPS